VHTADLSWNGFHTIATSGGGPGAGKKGAALAAALAPAGPQFGPDGRRAPDARRDEMAIVEVRSRHL